MNFRIKIYILTDNQHDVFHDTVSKNKSNDKASKI